MPTTHNYLTKIMAMLDAGKLTPGTLHLVRVAHDKWCGINRGRRCNCNPDVTINKPVGR